MGVEEALRTVAFPLVRFASFASNALLFGLLVVVLVVLRPAFASLADDSWGAARRRISERLEGMAQAALTAAVAATFIGLLLQVVLQAEVRGGVLGADSLNDVVGTRFGRWYVIRIPILAALAFLVAGRVRARALAGAAGGGTRSRAWWALWGTLAAALLVTVSASGHAAVAHPAALAVANDVLHLAAGGAWFSGIVILSVVLPDAWRRRDETDAVRVLAPAVERFSRLALVSIALVGITGTVNSLFHVAELGHLTTTGYGRAVLAKVALFVGVLVLGGINHFFVRRRLRREVQSSEPGRARRIFRRTVAAELALALLLMAVTGLLVGLSRTRQTSAASVVSSSSPIVTRP